MKHLWEEQALPISILLAGFFISVSVWYGLGLDTLQRMASIAGFLSMPIALLTYISNLEKDRRISAVDQISFFRKEVISKRDEFINFVKAKKDVKGTTYTLSRVGLDEPTIKFSNENYYSEVSAQLKLIRELDTRLMQTQLLDMLEEFSLRVVYGKTAQHEALRALYGPFVELVELNAVVLLQQKTFLSGPPTYSTVLKLYSLWKPYVDSRTPEERYKDYKSHS